MSDKPSHLWALTFVAIQGACWGRRQLSITTDLGHPNRADRLRHRRALWDQHVHLAQLGHDLFGGVSLLSHSDPPIGSHEPYFRADHFNGGGSKQNAAAAKPAKVAPPSS